MHFNKNFVLKINTKFTLKIYLTQIFSKLQHKIIHFTYIYNYSCNFEFCFASILIFLHATLFQRVKFLDRPIKFNVHTFMFLFFYLFFFFFSSSQIFFLYSLQRFIAVDSSGRSRRIAIVRAV